MTNKYAIGVDIGGSHICCAAFDLIENKVLEHSFSECKIDNHASASVIFSIWEEIIRHAIENVGKENVVGIGFAMPGPFDYENGIPLFTGENNKYENIYGLDVREALREMLHLSDEFPIRFINDAAAFAIGEVWHGKAVGSKKSLSITLGTGIGSAFIGKSLPVFSGETVPKDGCVWHLPFESGIADDYFSTRGLVNRYIKKTGRPIENAKEIAIAAQTDDLAKDVFKEFGIDLAYFLKPWIEKFGVEKIVIGGNISRAAELFLPSMKNAMAKEGITLVTIETSELKEHSSIIGSARLINPDYWKKINNRS